MVVKRFSGNMFSKIDYAQIFYTKLNISSSELDSWIIFRKNEIEASAQIKKGVAGVCGTCLYCDIWRSISNIPPFRPLTLPFRALVEVIHYQI